MHLKFRNKALKLITSICILMVSLNTKTIVNADNTATTSYSTHKYSGGVGNLLLYVDYASGTSSWEPYIIQGISGWMYTGWDNPIYITAVSSNNGSNMDFYTNDGSYWGVGNTVLAQTFHYNSSNTSVSPYSYDWYWAKILINDTNFRADDFTNDQAKGTILHEMGHAMGLKHNNSNPNSIMCQTSADRAVQSVQYTDNAAIITLYGN